MKHSLLLSVAVFSAMTAMAVPVQGDILTSPHRVGHNTATKSLQIERTVSGNYSSLRPGTLKDAARYQYTPFTAKMPIRRPAGVRPASYKAASSYTMPAYGIVVYSDSWMTDGKDHSGLYEIGAAA